MFEADLGAHAPVIALAARIAGGWDKSFTTCGRFRGGLWPPAVRSAPGEFCAGTTLDEQRNEVPNPAVFELGIGALDDRADALR